MLAELARRPGRGYTAHAIRHLCPPRVYLPRAGTFGLVWAAVEGGVRPDQIIASDDTWLSRATGAMLSNVALPWTVTEPWMWLSPYLGDPQGLVATVALATAIVELSVRRPRVITAHRIRELTDRADEYILHARRKAEQLHSRLGGLVFYASSMAVAIDDAMSRGDFDDLVLCDPSVVVNPAIEAILATIFSTPSWIASWNVPPDDPGFLTLCSMLAGGPRVFLYTATPVDGEDPATQIGPPWTSVFVDHPRASASGASRWVMSNRSLDVSANRTDIESPGLGRYKLFTDGEITAQSDLRAVRISRRVAWYYRDLLQAYKTCAVYAQRHYAVLVDGKLLGCIGVQRPTHEGDPGKVEYVFSPTHPRYPRLHYLMFMSICSSWFWMMDARDIDPVVTQLDFPEGYHVPTWVRDAQPDRAPVVERTSRETVASWLVTDAV